MIFEHRRFVCSVFRIVLIIIFSIFPWGLGVASVDNGLLTDLWDRFLPFTQEGEQRLLAFYPAKGLVTSAFGVRYHPIYDLVRPHLGVDIAGHKHSPVYAAQCGLVKSLGVEGGYGLTIVIDHGLGWETRYAHLERIMVKKGDTVGAGVVIAELGESGLTTGPHLHFELVYRGVPVNPESFLAPASFF